MKIGILLTTSPEHQNTYSVYRLASAFVGLNHEVSVFLMDDGVLNGIVNRSRRKLFSGFEELINKRVQVALCAMSAESRGVQRENLLPGIEYSSQAELSRIMKDSDRFLSFG